MYQHFCSYLHMAIGLIHIHRQERSKSMLLIFHRKSSTHPVITMCFNLLYLTWCSHWPCKAVYWYPRIAATSSHKLKWHKTRDIYSPSILEARSLKSRWQQDYLPSESSREQSLPCSSSVCVCVCCSFLSLVRGVCVCVCCSFLSLVRTLSLDSGPILLQDDLISRSLP